MEEEVKLVLKIKKKSNNFIINNNLETINR